MPDSLSELETDVKVFKDSLLKILDEDEIIEELCLTKWTDPRVLYVTYSLTWMLKAVILKDSQSVAAIKDEKG